MTNCSRKLEIIFFEVWTIRRLFSSLIVVKALTLDPIASDSAETIRNWEDEHNFIQYHCGFSFTRSHIYIYIILRYLAFLIHKWQISRWQKLLRWLDWMCAIKLYATVVDSKSNNLWLRSWDINFIFIGFHIHIYVEFILILR